MNTVRQIEKLNADELALGLTDAQSWHMAHRGNAWVYVGGLPLDLTEGDVLCVFSQWGEVEDVHLVRDESTGRSRGFTFVKYEDWRSAVLAVDNMNGAVLVGRTLRVDHTDYRPPKDKDGGGGAAVPPGGRPAPASATSTRAYEQGHAYAGAVLDGAHTLQRGHDVFRPEDKEGGIEGRTSAAHGTAGEVEAPGRSHAAVAVAGGTGGPAGGRREEAPSQSWKGKASSSGPLGWKGSRG